MFGKKKKPQQIEAPIDEDKNSQHYDGRIHGESLGQIWAALTGQDPRAIMPSVVGTVLHEGGTRPPWKWESKDQERVLMAWPQDQPIRAAVIMAGPKGGQLKPVTAVPLLEGFPNDLTVEEVHSWPEGLGGDVAVNMLEGKNPMWFFDPLFDRDRSDLTPGVTHTFWLAAAALQVRKALLDEITITQGPQYEAWAASWLEDHPDKTRLDAPPFKMDIRGKSFIMPGRVFGEYQLRATVEKVEDWQFEKMPVTALYLNFPFDDRPNLRLPLYASAHTLGKLKPEAGQEIEAYAWFEGRIIDLEAPPKPAGK